MAPNDIFKPLPVCMENIVRILVTRTRQKPEAIEGQKTTGRLSDL